MSLMTRYCIVNAVKFSMVNLCVWLISGIPAVSCSGDSSPTAAPAGQLLLHESLRRKENKALRHIYFIRLSSSSCSFSSL